MLLSAANVARSQTMLANPPITPTCRYDHGPLLRHLEESATGEWYLMGGPKDAQGIQVAFGVVLYVCATCGYCEMFDPEPERTAAEQKSI